MSKLIFERGSVLVDGSFQTADVIVGPDGRIEAVGAAISKGSEAGQRIDLSGKQLVPGLIDQHFHGLEDKTTVGCELEDIARIEAKNGVTGFLPGLCCPVREPLLKLLAKKQEEAKKINASARCLGFFLEGPFVNLSGAIPKNCMMSVDLGYAKEVLAAGGGMIRLMMVSPELDGATELIELLVSAGVTVALGHTQATIEQARRAVDAGARVATHIYNVYNKLPASTEGGVWPVGVYDALVADDRVTCELICDGIHVHPIKSKIVFRAKGPARMALITDSNVGAGLAPGEYRFPGWPPVRIREGDAVRDAEHDWLCGSAITMIEAVRRAPGILGCTPAQACTMASATIADTLGFGTQFGKIAAGYQADMIVLDKNVQICDTFVAGKRVYSR